MDQRIITEAEFQKLAMFKGHMVFDKRCTWTGDTDKEHSRDMTYYFDKDMKEIGHVSAINNKIGALIDPPREWDESFLSHCEIEPVSRTHTYGLTPPEIIAHCLPDVYPMDLVGEAAEVIVQVVNQGIDSHLEAVFGDFEWYNRTLKDGRPYMTALRCKVPKESMLVLLRRLYEFADDEFFEEAWSLRSDILSTIDLEEI